jgi:hypothetical protein
VTRDEALIIAERLMCENAEIPEIADEIFKAWSDGYATGDDEGYDRGWDAGVQSEIQYNGAMGG